MLVRIQAVSSVSPSIETTTKKAPNIQDLFAIIYIVIIVPELADQQRLLQPLSAHVSV